MLPWLVPYYARFQQAYAQQKIPHALMLVGQDGFGKKELSGLIARLFLCESPLKDHFCGVCHSCRLSLQASHPDIHVYGQDDARSIGVDLVRELNQMVTKSSQLGRGKVAIVQHAERLTEAAANALLKTLEEPAGNTLIIMLVDSAMKLLPTIVSRCQQWCIQAKPEVVLPWLSSQMNGQSVDPAVLKINAGSPFRTLSYLQSDGVAKHRVVIDHFELFLREPWQISTISKVFADELPLSIEWLILLLMDAVKYQNGVDSSYFHFSQETSLLKQLGLFPVEHLLDAVTHLLELRQSLNEMPSAIPTFLFSEWLDKYFSKD